MMRRLMVLTLVTILTLGMGGCGTTQSGGTVDKALDLFGLQRPAVTAPAGSLDGAPKTPPAMTKVAIRLHAGDVMNTTTDGRSLSVVTRIYKLRGRTEFEHASYESLQETTASHAGAHAPGRPDWERDVVEVKEMVLAPGQRFESIESVPAEAPFVAIVALFRSPSPQRWRFVFDTRSAAQTGLTLGLHACALSVAAGQPVGATADALRLAGVRCG